MARPLVKPVTVSTPRRTALSLHAQVALVIAVLSFLPNLVLVLTVFGPTLGRLEGADARVWLPLGLWLLAVAGLSGGIGYLLARQLLKPLSRMTQQIAALRRRAERLAGAKLSVEANEPQETLELKASFNELLAQVSLEQSRRSAFMATLVHDLKTPLIASGHLLAVVRDSDSLPRAERIELVGQVLRENQGLLELVQKLVDAYKLEHEDVVLKRERVLLSALVAKVFTRVQPLASSRGVALKCEGEARYGDIQALLQRHALEVLRPGVVRDQEQVAKRLVSGVLSVKVAELLILHDACPGEADVDFRGELDAHAGRAAPS